MEIFYIVTIVILVIIIIYLKEKQNILYRNTKETLYFIEKGANTTKLWDDVHNIQITQLTFPNGSTKYKVKINKHSDM